MYRQRFGLTHHPLPKNAQGKSFFDHSPGHTRLERAFTRLCKDPGLGVLCADAGVGKTAALRNLCARLPRPDFLVLYLCDTAVSPLDLYRTLAQEIGVRPSHRRSQLWADIKKTLIHLVDDRGTSPIIILDEAQHLSDRFLIDLSGFLNFAFDSRDLLTLWLCGLPSLDRTLRMHQHAPLLMRVSERVQLLPLERDAFCAAIDHGFRAAGATQKLLSDSALELLFRASRGVLRLAARILRLALEAAHERDQNFMALPGFGWVNLPTERSGLAEQTKEWQAANPNDGVSFRDARRRTVSALARPAISLDRGPGGSGHQGAPSRCLRSTRRSSQVDLP